MGGDHPVFFIYDGLAGIRLMTNIFEVPSCLQLRSRRPDLLDSSKSGLLSEYYY